MRLRGKTRREILFRAKRIDNGEWVEGDLVRIKDGKRILTMIYGFGDVDPSTVGQYTGLTDSNGKKIFEGDVIDVSQDPHFAYVGVALYRYGLFKVVFHKACFMKRKITEKNDEKGLYHFLETEQYQVVGNIFDNSELLKGGKQND